MNLAEGVISRMIQDLESSLETCTNIDWHWFPDAKIKELGEMLDFLRNFKMEERSKVKYMIADLVEMAQDVDECIESDIYFNNMFEPIQNEIKMAKMRMISFGADEENVEEHGAEEVVGLEEDVRKLLHKVVLNGSCNYNTWYIKGMAGIGKTTLARQVYKHKDVDGRFECRGWVSITSEMSYKEVLVELMQQMMVGSEEISGRDLLLERTNRSLGQMLCQHLKGKRFFIVFDNLLKGMRLSYILRDLQEDAAYGSRILCTSRYHSMDSNLNNTHSMRPLDSDKSWRLFCNAIFRGNNFTSDEKKFSKELERKGREMLKKCGGLPLAIIDVARQKAKQRLSGIEWEQLFDSVDLSESLKLLQPMYHTLDEDLKACFLCMSFFKENAIMRQEKLEQIWASSGLNTRRKVDEQIWVGGLKIRRTIDDGCTGLAKESIIEIADEFPVEREVKRCRVNPLLHMLSIKKAEEEMGFEMLRIDGDSRHSQNPRHRVIHCGREKFNDSKHQDNKHLISLIFHGGGGYLDKASQSYWESFESLNILDMEDFGVKTLSDMIGTLIELKYLGLRNNYIHEIPPSLGGLKRLEALDIALNFTVEVPDIIWEMSSLRNLHMSDAICHKPLKIDALQHLETLTYISIHDWTHEASTHLQKLGIEEIDENSNVGMLFASLAKLERLDHLILRGFRFRSMPCLDGIGVLDRLRTLRLDGRLARLPSGDDFPQQIRCLALVNTCLDDDPMPLLEKLPYLHCLKLRNAYTGRRMAIKDSGFAMLKVLRIDELSNLREFRVGEFAMQDLTLLEIKNCPRLKTLPEEIWSMDNLKFKMVTTKQIETEIRNSSITSFMFEVDMIP